MHRHTMVNRRFSREAYWGAQFALYMRDTKISPLLACLHSSRQRALLRSLYLESMAGPGSKVLLLGSVRPSAWIPNHTKLSCDRSWGTFSDD